MFKTASTVLILELKNITTFKINLITGLLAPIVSRQLTKKKRNPIGKKGLESPNYSMKKIFFLMFLIGCSYDYKIAVDTDTITYVINYETGDIYQKTLLEEPFLFESKENLDKPCMVKGIWYY